MERPIAPRAFAAMVRPHIGVIRAAVAGLLFAACSGGSSAGHGASGGTAASSTACGSAGLTLPAGFCATVFADSIGHARHIVVAANGDVYVNTSPGRGIGESAPAGGVIVALRDTNHDGRADVIARFGSSAPSPDTTAPAHSSSGASSRASRRASKSAPVGGTGIALYGGYVYAEDGARIVRYKLRSGELVPDTTAEVVVSDMPLGGDHAMHPFIVDTAGTIYVDMGSATNSCQAKNRTLRSPGHSPCTELKTRAGIWKFNAKRTGQTFTPAARFATGLRNSEGYAINPADGKLYATQHGRDQLGENWPKDYTSAQSAELPSEELVMAVPGGDYGWPYCYFDGQRGKLMLAPEYGGNGTTVGQCASKRAPAGWYPAHWAPDDLLFYTGTQFPAHYRGGAFIAFHGSWNRAPLPQGGYNVSYVPWSAHPDSTHETFADGFAGATKQPDRADHRPVGLAQGPDGSLYITDDQHGRVWKVSYSGS